MALVSIVVPVYHNAPSLPDLLASFRALADRKPGDFVSIITDYGWDMAGNDEFGAKIIKELADKYLDPADAALIKQWKL